MKLNLTLSKTLALVAPVTLLTTTHSFGALNCYLKIDGIKGEASDGKHKDWTGVIPWSTGYTPRPT